jgi:hypothetical protein
MTGSGIGGVSIGGGGGASIDLTGYATEMWTDENYVGKEFFSSLFKAYDSNGDEVLPNDTETQIDNIKAMFGFWTDFYISALGTGGQSTVGLRLAQLADVNVAGVQDGQALVYDATNQKWVPGTAGGGTDMQTIWAQMALSGNEQINYSHISNAVKINNGTITIGSSTITPLTSVAFNDLTAHPTTISGYGITDAKIVNGAITLGTNTITPLTQSTGDNRYLKLAGGAMTGGITCAQNKYATSSEYGIDMNNSDIIGCNAIRFGDTSDDYSEAVMFYRTNGNFDSFRAIDGTFYFGANNGSEKGVANIGSAAANLNYVYSNEIHPGNNNNLWLNTSTNNHIIANGPLIIPISNDVALSSYGRYALAIGGDPRNNEAHIGIDNNEIMAKGSASTTATLYLNAEGGNCIINETAGNCGIGTNSPSHKLHVSGGIYASSYVSCLSDERKKDIVGDVNLTVEQIAQARTVLFYWKDGRDNDLHMGSIAQDWQKITPQLVYDRGDELSMDYSVIALMCGIKNARRLVNHETRLRRLEKMFAINDNDIED